MLIVSHTTAGSFHHLRVPADPELHVIVERNRRVRIPGLRAHRIEVRDRSRSRGGADLVLQSPTCFCGFRRRQVARCSRTRCGVDSARSTRCADNRPWAVPGMARPSMPVLADLAASPYSEGEVKVHRLLRQAGIDGWELANAPVYDSEPGPDRARRPALRGFQVVVVDGRAFHSDDVAFQRDRTRQNRLILRYIPRGSRGTQLLLHWPQQVSPRSGRRCALRRETEEEIVRR